MGGRLRRVALTGGSGLVGRAVERALHRDGVVCVPLVRDRAKAREGAAFWSPQTGEIDREALEGVDALIHLAGEPLAAGRWNRTKKDAIRRSRVEATRLLCSSLADLERPPAVVVSASAIGYYGDTGDAVVDESAPPGEGFLAEVCRGWEAATEPARDAGIRVVCLRIGMVLALSGGALSRMVPVFRWGLGGRLGSGRQWMSWIALPDLVAVMVSAIVDQRFAGPVNAVSPSPVTNAEFTCALARALHRPAWVSVPSPLLRLVFGRQFADQLLLASQRVRPGKLLDIGFSWRYPELQSALTSRLGAQEIETP